MGLKLCSMRLKIGLPGIISINEKERAEAINLITVFMTNANACLTSLIQRIVRKSRQKQASASEQ